VLSAIGSYQRGGINVYGAVGGASVYRTNALTLDPNHLGIMLIVPLLVLLPLGWLAVNTAIPKRHGNHPPAGSPAR